MKPKLIDIISVAIMSLLLGLFCSAIVVAMLGVDDPKITQALFLKLTLLLSFPFSIGFFLWLYGDLQK